ncbi:MAG: hypothetical protein RBT65_10840 [Methanolobus sp.]|jgi:hypothetical protein|nr:hypothetical protein [Methanolobus sp.]
MQKDLANDRIKENTVELGSLVEDKDHGIGFKSGIGMGKRCPPYSFM